MVTIGARTVATTGATGAEDQREGGRVFAYTTGAEQALEQGTRDGWTGVSVKEDWATVF